MRWCPLDMTPPKTSPAIHLRWMPVSWHRANSALCVPVRTKPPRQSLTCLTAREETCPAGNKHPVQQLFSVVFLILWDKEESLQTAQATAICRGDLHTPVWISALPYLAGSSSHSTAVLKVASFEGQASIGMTTHRKQERDLISQSPSLTSF